MKNNLDLVYLGNLLGSKKLPLGVALLVPTLLWWSPLAESHWYTVLLSLVALFIGALLGGVPAMEQTRLFYELLPISRRKQFTARALLGMAVLVLVALVWRLTRKDFASGNSSPTLLTAAFPALLFSASYYFGAVSRSRAGAALSWMFALLLCGAVLALTSPFDWIFDQRFGSISGPLLIVISLGLFLLGCWQINKQEITE
jgi:hypothetical protein